ncbi:phage tail sheath subtilisin-like domain-containing protein [Entomobacter blattae]|uniref:Phage tail sheath protein subtilisin-like domain protein n=1 Tax=Entomobacter blattae TaxID=2762277 RepID=A0A7H1NUI1_9PROT|nr:phage tail sheath subtilisin-like domain-containing protein [Entomobacter blattae]QNT79441.1 Phage tail sheath protein subtilisin-like domain protein [Entomobacter blattae]
MAISIPNYSDSNIVPGFYFSLDNRNANTATITRRVLLIGQITSTAQATAGIVEQALAGSEANTRYGAGSQLAQMVLAYRNIDTFGEVWALPLADDAQATSATATITIENPASQEGVISLYIGDNLLSIRISRMDTTQTIAQAITTAVTANPTLPVSAIASNNSVMLTAKNKGESLNALSLTLNLLGASNGQTTPPGLKLTLTPFTGGAVNPVSALEVALSQLGDKFFDLFIIPYTDTESLDALEQFLNDTSGRWSPMAELYGHVLTAFSGTYGQATTLGNSRNNQHETILATSDSPSEPWKWAAQAGAQIALSIRQNPALPITQLELTVRPPTQQFPVSQRNSLLYDGISTFTVSDSGSVILERLVTTYTDNPAGLPDNSYRDIETLMTSVVCMQDLHTFLASQYGRFILVDDAAKIPAGVPATTAQLIKAAVVSRYRTQAQNLWVQNTDRFAANIRVENAGSGTVKLFLPYQFANQLRIIAGTLQFTKP